MDNRSCCAEFPDRVPSPKRFSRLEILRRGWCVLGLLICVCGWPLAGEAAIKGSCSDCHTMHNSQQGSAVAFTLDSTGQKVASDQPMDNLLKTDCLGCHTYVGSETISMIGESKVPIVLNLSEPKYPADGSFNSALAGGNFHWVINSGDAYGHNVTGISSEDLRFPPTHAPGGVERSGDCVQCHGSLSAPLAGCKGCHVTHHHAEGANVVTGQKEGWYRFLGSVMQEFVYEEPISEGVVGIEAPDWEQNPSTDRHNTYQGKTGLYSNYLESGSISQKCAGCHGYFHNQTMADSIWIRHPVDATIPPSGEFSGLTTYNPLVPVARPNVLPEDAGFSAVELGSDLVSCISCHRPHGSPYPAMLRWGYRDWPGTDSHTQQPAENGCAVCHTAKS